jgi:predicted amidohydrolase
MTRNHNFKRRVRDRAAKTGESYTGALRHLRVGRDGASAPHAVSVRLAVAQSTGRFDPGNIAELRAAGEETRALMRQAKESGARIVHFAEGSLCSPNKRIVSSTGPESVGPADWSRCNWDVLRGEITAVCRLARELGLWVVLGSPHQLSAQRRPHNSLYVISDRGELVTRYDERMLSNTKLSFMYTPGAEPVTFEIDGLRFGCALGMEAHYPELFIAYERLNVDCVLFSTTGGGPFAAEIAGHAASNSLWTSFAVHAQQGPEAPAGIVAPTGIWVARSSPDVEPSLAIADISTEPSNPARPWRRAARGGLYQEHLAGDDQRSAERTVL